MPQSAIAIARAPAAQSQHATASPHKRWGTLCASSGAAGTRRPLGHCGALKFRLTRELPAAWAACASVHIGARDVLLLTASDVRRTHLFLVVARCAVTLPFERGGANCTTHTQSRQSFSLQPAPRRVCAPRPRHRRSRHAWRALVCRRRCVCCEAHIYIAFIERGVEAERELG
jgi:hypothetical protein